jgi:predicted ATP-dependent serine protease
MPNLCFQVLSLLEQRIKNEYLAGHLPTQLKGLDAVLCGGIPFGVVTELVSPAGIGKTQVRLRSRFQYILLYLSRFQYIVLCFASHSHT